MDEPVVIDCNVHEIQRDIIRTLSIYIGLLRLEVSSDNLSRTKLLQHKYVPACFIDIGAKLGYKGPQMSST